MAQVDALTGAHWGSIAAPGAPAAGNSASGHPAL
jgi:hypothetical protein